MLLFLLQIEPLKVFRFNTKATKGGSIFLTPNKYLLTSATSIQSEFIFTPNKIDIDLL